jgi:hypothetical protein
MAGPRRVEAARRSGSASTLSVRGVDRLVSAKNALPTVAEVDGDDAVRRDIRPASPS